MSSDVMRHIREQVVDNAEARCNKSLRPRKPEGSLGRTAQDVHLDSHTAPELCYRNWAGTVFYTAAHRPVAGRQRRTREKGVGELRARNSS